MKSRKFYVIVGANIKKYRDLRNYSLQVLGERVGLTKKTIQRYENGEIKIDVNRLGEIASALDVDVSKLLEGAEEHLGVESAARKSNVPLIGVICAGDGILAEQNIEEYINYPFPNKRQPDYALRVKGNSMSNVNIDDGDIVYMRAAPWAEYNGQIVAALIHDQEDGTLKRMKWSEGSNRIQLIPENDAYSTIEVMPNEVTVCGVYMGHFKPEQEEKPQ